MTNDIRKPNQVTTEGLYIDNIHIDPECIPFPPPGKVGIPITEIERSVFRLLDPNN